MSTSWNWRRPSIWIAIVLGLVWSGAIIWINYLADVPPTFKWSVNAVSLVAWLAVIARPWGQPNKKP